MDPLLFSLPELILSDMEYPDPSGPPSSSYFSPHPLHLARESAHIHNLDRVDPFGPSEPHLAGDAPPSLNLQGDGSHPGLAPLFPDLMFPSCLSLDPCWPTVSPASSTPLPLVLVPHVLVPVGGPLCCGPCSGPPPLLLLPEVRHTWCSCRRPRGRDPDSRGTPSEGQRAEPEEEEQHIDNLRGTPVPPGCFPSFDDESLNFEEFVRTVNSIGLKAGEKRQEEEEEPLAWGDSFLQYVEVLCSDEAFVREAESTLSAEFLDSLLSADPEPVDLLLLGKRERETEETPEDESRDRPPAPDPVDLLSYRELLLEILAAVQQQLADLSAAESDGATPGTLSVEEPSRSESPASPDRDGGNAPPSPRRPEASPSPLDHDGRLFLDHMASLRLRAVSPPDAGPTPEARDGPGASGREPRGGAPPGGPPAPEAPSTPRSGADEDPTKRSPEDSTPEPADEDLPSDSAQTSGEGVTKRAEEEEKAREEGEEESKRDGAVRDGRVRRAWGGRRLFKERRVERKTREEEAGGATQGSGNGKEGGAESPSKRGRGGGEDTAGGGGVSEEEAPGRDRSSPPSTRSAARRRRSARLSTKYEDFLMKRKKENGKPARRRRR